MHKRKEAQAHRPGLVDLTSFMPLLLHETGELAGGSQSPQRVRYSGRCNSPSAASIFKHDLPSACLSLPRHLTRLLSLKIGRMIDIAMKPTMLPISTIISGSIIAVTLLMTAFSSRA